MIISPYLHFALTFRCQNISLCLQSHNFRFRSLRWESWCVHPTLRKRIIWFLVLNNSVFDKIILVLNFLCVFQFVFIACIDRLKHSLPGSHKEMCSFRSLLSRLPVNIIQRYGNSWRSLGLWRSSPGLPLIRIQWLGREHLFLYILLQNIGSCVDRLALCLLGLLSCTMVLL